MTTEVVGVNCVRHQEDEGNLFINNIKGELDMSTVTEVRDLEFNLQDYLQGIKEREARQEELLVEAKAKYAALGTDIEEAQCTLDAAKAVLSDRQSVLKELGGVTPKGEKEDEFEGTTLNIGGHYFLIEKPLKGKALSPIREALKNLTKEEALNIINNNLLDFITDRQYQSLKKKLGLEELVLETSIEDDEIDTQFEEHQNRIYDDAGNELF